MDFTFIITYFVTKSLPMITAFGCWTPEQVVELWRCASDAGVKLNVLTNFHRLPELPAYGTFREGILLDVTCPHATLVLVKASLTRAFNHRHSWLLLHNSSYDRAIIADTLGNCSILPDADVIWSFTDTLVDVYRVKQDQPFLLTVLGLDRNCTREELEAQWGALPTAATRRKDLRGVFLKAAVVLTQPQHFKGWSDLRDRQIDTYPKVTYPLVMLTTQDLHYRLNLVQVDTYGVARNGSFDGLAGLLQRRQVELGVASMFMRSDRTRVLHYIAETVTINGAFIFRQPSRSAVSNVFLLPFSGGVWAACGGVAAAAALLLPASCRLHARLPAAHPSLALLSLPECCTFALGTLCQQGFPVAPPVTSVRLVMFCALLASLFAFTAYSAKVVAILQTPSDAIRTLDDLTRSTMVLGVQETTYKKVYFDESSDPATRRLFRRKLEPAGERAYRSVAGGIARVRAGLYAFQVERSPAYDVISRTFTEREKCSLREVEAFKLPTVAVPMRIHSGYRDLFASRLRWQRETGLPGAPGAAGWPPSRAARPAPLAGRRAALRARRRWLAAEPRCAPGAAGWPPSRAARPAPLAGRRAALRARRRWLAAEPRCAPGAGGFLAVGLVDVLPAIQVLGLGVGLAMLLLIAEISVHAFTNRWTL